MISIKWLSILASFQLDDVIGCDEISTGWFFKSEVTRLWVIEAGPANTLLKKCKNITGDQRKQFQLELAEKSKGKTKYNYCYTISVSLYSLEWFMKLVYKSLYKVNMYIAVLINIIIMAILLKLDPSYSSIFLRAAEQGRQSLSQ